LTDQPTTISRGGSTTLSLLPQDDAAEGKTNAINNNKAAMLFAIDCIEQGFCFLVIRLAIDVIFTERRQFLVVQAVITFIIKEQGRNFRALWIRDVQAPAGQGMTTNRQEE
tara:strand:- start:1246 stop:1578 length:333 start_codon:yes stop_codon:yes gene_type:complete